MKHAIRNATYDPKTQRITAVFVGGCRLQEEEHLMAQVRGWGAFQYLPDAEAIQDEVGQTLAAAIEMRELLNRLVIAHEGIQFRTSLDNGVPGHIEEIKECCQSAKALLAKIEGETA